MARPDRRQMLIDAAAELFADRAYDEVTTTEIARRAGVAYGLIAHHFGNKRGLYLATIRAAADRLRVVHEAEPEGAAPGERLRDALDRHIAFMEDNAARPISGADIAAAHADLRTADPATTTVTAVAGRWGFLHAGRFAAAYKTAYGHPPSETLRS